MIPSEQKSRMRLAIAGLIVVPCAIAFWLLHDRVSPIATVPLNAQSLAFNETSTRLLVSGITRREKRQYRTVVLDLSNVGSGSDVKHAPYGPVAAWLFKDDAIVATNDNGRVFAIIGSRSMTTRATYSHEVGGQFAVDHLKNIFALHWTYNPMDQQPMRVHAFRRLVSGRYAGPVAVTPDDRHAFCVAVCADETAPRIAVSYDDGEVVIGRVNYASPELGVDQEFSVRLSGPAWMTLSADGDTLLTHRGDEFCIYALDDDGASKKVAMEAWAPVAPFDSIMSTVFRPLAASKNGEFAAYTAKEQTNVIRLPSGKRIFSVEVPARCIALSSDAQLLALAPWRNDNVRIYEVPKSEPP